MAMVIKRPATKYWHAGWRDSSGVFHLRSTKQTDRTAALAIALEFERAERAAGAGTLTEVQARKVLADILERAGGEETLRCPSAREFLTDWLQGKEANKSEGTGARYGKAIREFLRYLGPKADKPLVAVTPRLAQGFVTERTRIGLAPGTISLDAKVVRSAFNRARRQGIITNNPLDAIELPAAAPIAKGTFTPEEVQMLIEAASTPEWALLIAIAYYTGQRLTDCVRMRWEDVDLAKQTWALTQGKTGTELTVPLHPELVSRLEQAAGTDRPTKHVMPHMADLGPGGRHGLSQGFMETMRRAGIDRQRVKRAIGVRTVSRRSFHSLRHSFTSALLNSGVPEEIRMRLSGHKSREMHRGYSHAELATLRAAVEKLPGLTKGGSHAKG